MTQTELQIYAPVARYSDPLPSHLAALEHTATGRRRAHAEAVLAVIQNEPGLTYREIARRLPKMEAVEIERRCNDLATENVVRRSIKRECTVSGRLAQTWEAA